jgi:hypothetical protein
MERGERMMNVTNLAWMAVGAWAGAFALSICTCFLHWVYCRNVFGDGQYAFVFFFTVPMGAILGALTGLVLAYLSQGQASVAGSVALRGGGILSALFLFLGMFALSGTGKRTFWERLSAAAFWCGAALLWCGALVIFGLGRK